MTAPDIVIVGAGVAGLTAARDLALAGLSVTVLEAAEGVGGKLRGHEVGGLRLDAGAESFATRGGTVEKLVRELGMADLLAAPAEDGAWLRSADGRSLPLPVSSLLGIPGTPMAADVLEAVGFGGALRAQLDALMPGFVGSRERKLGALVRRRMGARVLDRLVVPVVSGVHSRHPDELDVDVVAPGLRHALKTRDSLARAVLSLREAAPAGSQVNGLSGGVHRLAAELHADLRAAGAEIRLGTRARDVAADGVTTSSGERILARRAVLCSGAGKTTERGSRISLATLVVECPELDVAPRGTGMLVAPGSSGVAAKALTHATAKWRWLADAAGPHRHVLRLSYGGVAIDLTGPELAEQARVDAQALLGVDIPASAVQDAARVDWLSAGMPAPALPDGVRPIGEATSGVGLAAVIGQARMAAAAILSEHTGNGSVRGDD